MQEGCGAFADAVDLHELVRLRVENGGEAAEPFQKQMRHAVDVAARDRIGEQKLQNSMIR